MLSAAVVSERLKYAEMKNIQDIRRVPHVSLPTKDAQFVDGRGSTGGKHTVVSTIHGKAATPTRTITPLEGFRDRPVRDFWITSDGEPRREASRTQSAARGPRHVAKQAAEGGDERPQSKENPKRTKTDGTWRPLPESAAAAVNSWLQKPTTCEGRYAEAGIADVAICASNQGVARVRFQASEFCHFVNRSHSERNQVYQLRQRILHESLANWKHGIARILTIHFLFSHSLVCVTPLYGSKQNVLFIVVWHHIIRNVSRFYREASVERGARASHICHRRGI